MSKEIKNYLSKEEIDELIDQQICEMIKEDPVKLTVFMLSQMGRQAVEANAETLKISQESNVGEDRYKITCNIKVKKIGKAIPKTKTPLP